MTAPTLEELLGPRFVNAILKAYERFGYAVSVVPIALIREELAAQSLALVDAGQGWQPIETAPKDGAWVLGWALSDDSYYRVCWDKNHDQREKWCTSFGSFCEGYITHWMPLPAGPGEKA